MADLELVEKNAREMYADDLRNSSGVQMVAFDDLPLMVKNVYYAAAGAAVVDCTTRGRRQRMGLQG